MICFNVKYREQGNSVRYRMLKKGQSALSSLFRNFLTGSRQCFEFGLHFTPDLINRSLTSGEMEYCLIKFCVNQWSIIRQCNNWIWNVSMLLFTKFYFSYSVIHIIGSFWSYLPLHFSKWVDRFLFHLHLLYSEL